MQNEKKILFSTKRYMNNQHRYFQVSKVYLNNYSRI